MRSLGMVLLIIGTSFIGWGVYELGHAYTKAAPSSTPAAKQTSNPPTEGDSSDRGSDATSPTPTPPAPASSREPSTRTPSTPEEFAEDITSAVLIASCGAPLLLIGGVLLLLSLGDKRDESEQGAA